MSLRKKKGEVFVWSPTDENRDFDAIFIKRHNVSGPVQFENEDHALEYLAEVLVEAYLESKKYAIKKQFK